jgi:hypothetical protein
MSNAAWWLIGFELLSTQPQQSARYLPAYAVGANFKSSNKFCRTRYLYRSSISGCLFKRKTFPHSHSFSVISLTRGCVYLVWIGFAFVECTYLQGCMVRAGLWVAVAYRQSQADSDHIALSRTVQKTPLPAVPLFLRVCSYRKRVYLAVI